MSRRLSALHPFLAALFPVMALAASNATSVSMPQVWRTAGVCVVLAGVLWAAMRPLLGSWPKAGVMASVLLVVFFSYGHVRGWALERWPGVRHRHLLLPAALIVGAAFVLLRRGRKEPTRLAQGLTLVFAVLVATSVGQLVSRRWQFSAQAPGDDAGKGAAAAPAKGAAVSSPDVYYIILDGYAGARALREVYGYDNTPFLDALRSRGFYVADKSRSNYAQTPLSLASSTNMNYLAPELEAQGVAPLYRMIENNRVMKSFRERGYKTVTFQSGWEVTARNRYSDWDVGCGGWDEFNRVLARTTMLEVAGIFQPIEKGSRDRLLCQFARLVEIPRRVAAPRYVFAHVVSPEPPLLFGRDGQPYAGKTEDRAYEEWQDRPGYLDQLLFINRKTLEAIDRILSESAIPPIIVVQSDHGSAALDPGMFYTAGGEPVTGSEPGLDGLLRERMDILNAYHVPGGAPALYPSISPVNSFRVVLNARFGEKLPLLPDRSYFSRYAFPYKFVDVTDRVATDAPPPGAASKP